jgi:Tfp pilus assembly protein PilZ
MFKRNLERISSNINVKFCCCVTDYYAGVATNLTEKGMFISTEMCFPLETQLDIIMMLSKDMLTVPAKIRWMRKSMGLYDGIGVEIIKAPMKYLEFVTSLRNSDSCY